MAPTRTCFINIHITRTIFLFFAIFHTHLNYANLIWGQNLNVVSRIIILQKKTLRIMSFQSRHSHSSPLFEYNHLLKPEYKVLIKNILFINKSLNNLLPLIFKNWSIFGSGVHNYQAVSSTSDKILKPSYRTDSFTKKLDRCRRQ